MTFVTAAERQFESGLLAGLGKPVISDRKPGFGAWSGIDTALANSSNEWAFVLACDLPFVSAELVNLLAGFAEDDYDAVVPRQSNGRLQPLCAFYRVKPAAVLCEQMLGGGQPLPPVHSVFDNLSTRILEPTEYGHLANSDNLFVNINFPADLAAALPDPIAEE